MPLRTDGSGSTAQVVSGSTLLCLFGVISAIRGDLPNATAYRWHRPRGDVLDPRLITKRNRDSTIDEQVTLVTNPQVKATFPRTQWYGPPGGALFIS